MDFGNEKEEEVGIFAVKGGRKRMVIDARFTNSCHRKPPRTVLGSSSAISSIDLSAYALELGGYGGVAESQSSQSDSDVKDAFYQYDVHELGSWFCLELVDAEAFGIVRC